jgi:hypothetical protein
MVAAVVVALVSGVLALTTSLWVQWRQLRSERQARAEERELTAKERLDTFREPLLRAADDVAGRIGNIRQRNFFVYLNSQNDWRRRLALLGTLYRFCKYWATVEALYGQVSLIRFETEDETKAVGQLLREIGQTFADDELGHDLMVWREEQRAVAELMSSVDEHGQAAVIGFASFVQRYPDQLETWFGQLASGLARPEVKDSQRLARLQAMFEQLSDQLQVGRAQAL